MFSVIAHMKHCSYAQKDIAFGQDVTQGEEDLCISITQPLSNTWFSKVDSDELKHDDQLTPISPNAELVLLQEYLLQCTKTDMYQEMRLRQLKLPNGTSCKMLLEDYLAIYSFAKRTNLSRADGDELLNLVRNVGARHGCQIPLPRFFRTMEKGVLRFKDSRGNFKSRKVEIRLPIAVVGEMITQPACGAILEIMEVVRD